MSSQNFQIYRGRYNPAKYPEPRRTCVMVYEEEEPVSLPSTDKEGLSHEAQRLQDAESPANPIHYYVDEARR